MNGDLSAWFRLFRRSILALLLCAAIGLAAGTDPALLALRNSSFFLGREYFVLRSGRAELIVQADRVDLGPAVTCLLFDAQDSAQSAAKEKAFNYVAGEGVDASALQVVLGSFAFTALGHRTDTRWVVADGIPAMEAVWWAGGIRVTERILATAGTGAFRRSIRLEGADLVSEEAASLRLFVPPGQRQSAPSTLVSRGKGASIAVAVSGNPPLNIKEADGLIEIGPLMVGPSRSVSVESALLVQIPAGDVGEILKQAATWVASSGKAELGRTREAWAAASSVVTADRTVPEIFDKARFGLAAMIADDGTMNAGIFEYGAQWVRDTSNTAVGAIHAGHFELARRALERILTTMITKEGVTMIAGSFDAPDREQFDQMGELMHVLKSYRDWTGDDSLVRKHRETLLPLIERPLQPVFRDDTGMVHNRREFWERTFNDAYELAYQMWVIQGLRDAADLASSLGAEDRAPRWRQEADRILHSMLSHPTRALVHEGRLIKRRNVTGEVALDAADFPGFNVDVPLKTEKYNRIMPDATQALPIAMGLVDPRSELARQTLSEIEHLWNARWSDGGYDRYNTSSQPDQPGPWPFATCFILRAQHESGLFDRSRRSLEWLNTVQGGRVGFWFEEIPSVRSQARTAGIIPWTSGELALFVVRSVLGVRFEGGRVVLRPALYPGSPAVSADLRFRNSRLRLQIDGPGAIAGATVNGVEVKPRADGSLVLPEDFASGTVVIRTTETSGR